MGNRLEERTQPDIDRLNQLSYDEAKLEARKFLNEHHNLVSPWGSPHGDYETDSQLYVIKERMPEDSDLVRALIDESLEVFDARKLSKKDKTRIKNAVFVAMTYPHEEFFDAMYELADREFERGIKDVNIDLTSIAGIFGPSHPDEIDKLAEKLYRDMKSHAYCVIMWMQSGKNRKAFDKYVESFDRSRSKKTIDYQFIAQYMKQSIDPRELSEYISQIQNKKLRKEIDSLFETK